MDTATAYASAARRFMTARLCEQSVAIHLFRHCERSAAIHGCGFGFMDCRGFASQ
jgi:hypothetical protein